MSNQNIGVRLRGSDRELLDKVCQLRGEDLSDFVRRAVKLELARLNYLSAEQAKALGVGDKRSGP